MGLGKQIQQPNSNSRDWSWPLWPILPLYPYGQRRTLKKEIVKDKKLYSGSIQKDGHTCLFFGN